MNMEAYTIGWFTVKAKFLKFLPATEGEKQKLSVSTVWN